MVYDLESWSGW